MSTVGGLPDPDWYFENVLADAEPGGPRRTVIGPAGQWTSWWRTMAAAADEPLRSAALHGFVLSSPELTALGVTRARARHAVRKGRWTAAGHGAVAPLDVREPDTTPEARAIERRRRHAITSVGATRRRRDVVISGRSAAILDGLPTLRVPKTPEITALHKVGLGRRRPRHLYGASIDVAETSDWFGVPVECVPRTLVTLARHDRRDAIMAADAALRENLVDRDAIELALRTATGWPWVRQARAVLALADPRAESPLESITRLALHDDGFPEPDLQVWLGVDRVDFYWREYGLVLEADGRVKYGGDAYWEEKKREQRLRSHARRIERVIWSDVVDTWPATRARLRPCFR